jgi:septation ring formation regulator EzrA
MANTEEVIEKLLKLFDEYIVHQTMASERIKHAEVIADAKERLVAIMRSFRGSNIGYSEARTRITAVYTMTLTKIGSKDASIIEEISVQFGTNVQPLFNP